MVPEFSVTAPEGSAAFEGLVRCSDESPRDVFSVTLMGHPELFGFWQSTYLENNKAFNVEIVRFGWGDKWNVGNPRPITRHRLSKAQSVLVKAMILKLFNDPTARGEIVPFSLNPQFTGQIDFGPDWILLDDRIVPSES